MIRFAATKFDAGINEYGILVIEFSSPDHYLRFQRDADLERSDSEDIHFECDGQGWGGYDVIRAVEFTPQQLRISLIPERAEDFDDRLEYDVTLRLSDAEAMDAGRWLERLFARTGLLRS